MSKPSLAYAPQIRTQTKRSLADGSPAHARSRTFEDRFSRTTCQSCRINSVAQQDDVPAVCVWKSGGEGETKALNSERRVHQLTRCDSGTCNRPRKGSCAVTCFQRSAFSSFFPFWRYYDAQLATNKQEKQTEDNLAR
jgi:hypothetical protein